MFHVTPKERYHTLMPQGNLLLPDAEGHKFSVHRLRSRKTVAKELRALYNRRLKRKKLVEVGNIIKNRGHGTPCGARPWKNILKVGDCRK